jgi:excisionase family DNA binding protein
MDDEPTLRQIKQGLEHLRQALEELESAMIEFEEKLSGVSSVRPQERRGLDLLSIPEACQELGMGKSWLYGKLKSGEIPSLKLGNKIKIKRSALEEYLQNQVIQQPQDTVGQLTDQVQGTVGEVTGRVVQGVLKTPS